MPCSTAFAQTVPWPRQSPSEPLSNRAITAAKVDMSLSPGVLHPTVLQNAQAVHSLSGAHQGCASFLRWLQRPDGFAESPDPMRTSVQWRAAVRGSSAFAHGARLILVTFDPPARE